MVQRHGTLLLGTKAKQAEAFEFGRHQVISTSDHSLSLSNGSLLGNYLSLCMYGFLNDHTAHHLFPSIDHGKHHLYRNIMQETFKEFNVPYCTNSIIRIGEWLAASD